MHIVGVDSIVGASGLGVVIVIAGGDVVVVAGGVLVVFIADVGMGIVFVAGIGMGVVVKGVGMGTGVVVAGVAAGVIGVAAGVVGIAAGVVGIAAGIGVGVVVVVVLIPVAAVLVFPAVLVVLIPVAAVVVVVPTVVVVLAGAAFAAVVVVPIVVIVPAFVVVLAVIVVLAVGVVAAVVVVGVILVVVVLALRGGAVIHIGTSGVVITGFGGVILVAHAFVVSLHGGIIVGTMLPGANDGRRGMHTGCGGITYAFRGGNGNAALDELSLGPVDVNRSFFYKRKGRGGAHGVSLMGGAWLASSVAFWALVFLQTGLSMVIDGRELTSMGCVPWLFHPLRLRLLPPFSFLPRLRSFHLLIC